MDIHEKKEKEDVFANFSRKTLPAISNMSNIQSLSDRYKIKQIIGRGSLGKVHLAQDLLQNRAVALKFLLENSTSSEIQNEKFIREIYPVSNLSHPNIISIYDYGTDNDSPFFSMEYIQGETFDCVLNKQSKNLRELLKIFQKILSAMSYAHQVDCVHGNLKPSNIILDKTFEPRISDFGIIKSFPSESSFLSKNNLGYLPPELLKRNIRELDKTSDVYCLGTILYKIITGRLPFQMETAEALLKEIDKKNPVHPKNLKSDLPKKLGDICLKALEKEKFKRYSNAELFFHDFEAFMQTYGVDSFVEEKKVFGKIFTVVVLILCLIIIYFLFYSA